MEEDGAANLSKDLIDLGNDSVLVKVARLDSARKDLSLENRSPFQYRGGDKKLQFEPLAKIDQQKLVFVEEFDSNQMSADEAEKLMFDFGGEASIAQKPEDSGNESCSMILMDEEVMPQMPVSQQISINLGEGEGLNTLMLDSQSMIMENRPNDSISFEMKKNDKADISQHMQYLEASSIMAP